jgi:hypothetical protein
MFHQHFINNWSAFERIIVILIIILIDCNFLILISINGMESCHGELLGRIWCTVSDLKYVGWWSRSSDYEGFCILGYNTVNWHSGRMCHLHLQDQRLIQAGNSAKFCLISVSCWLLVWLILWPWRWRQQVPLKHPLMFDGLHRIISKIKLFNTKQVYRGSNVKSVKYVYDCWQDCYVVLTFMSLMGRLTIRPGLARTVLVF